MAKKVNGIGRRELENAAEPISRWNGSRERRRE